MLDRKELAKKQLDVYVGYNLVRRWFREKSDADAFLQVLHNEGHAPSYRYYGVDMPARVERSVYDGEVAWEVITG